MSVTSSMEVLGDDEPFVLVVEPWATEFTINPGDKCRVVAKHSSIPPTFAVTLCMYSERSTLVVWVQEGGTTYEFHRNDNLELDNDNLVPE